MLITTFGCSKKTVTSAGEPRPEGSIHNMPKSCFVMKNINTEEFECFGCANDKCDKEDLTVWEYYDQDVAQQKGYSCIETAEGCALAQRGG